MRILILGGDGMLGHQLCKQLSLRHAVRVTLRQDLATYARFAIFNETNTYSGVNVRDTERLLDVFGNFKPEAVINAIGIVKQRSDARESVPSILINSLLPHQLAIMCRLVGARLVHMSTDCVFSGSRGNYSEADSPDAEDLYGRSKLLGELGETHCITLRTSIIGRELTRKTGLIEWFLAQQGSVRGFTRAIYSGFTTIEMSRIIETILLKHASLYGIHHIASEPISKHDLLLIVKKHLDSEIEVTPYSDFQCDRSLNAERFIRLTGYQPPSWGQMIGEMVKDAQGGQYDF